MAVGMHDLARQIKNLRVTIEKIFTKELVEKLESLIDNINKTIGSSEFQKNIGEVINQLKEALKSVNESEIIQNAGGIIKRIKDILDNIEDKKIGEFFNDISAIIHRIASATEMLDKISSLNGLKQFAEYLNSISPLLFSAAGPLGEVLLKLISKSITTDSKDVLRQILQLERERYFVEIDQLRTLHSINYSLTVTLQYMLHNFPVPENKMNKVINEQSNSERMLVVPMMSHDTIEYLKIASKQGEELIGTLYNKKYTNKDIDSILKNICIPALQSDHWTTIMRAMVFQEKEFKKKIIFEREALTYKQVQRLYGRESVSDVMKTLATMFSKKGGDDLYYAVANTRGNAPREFTNLIQSVPLSHVTSTDAFRQLPEKHREALQKINTFYHDREQGAARLIMTEWRKLQQEDPNLPALTEESQNVILIRAFLEHSKLTGKFFFSPHNILREIGNGTLDFFNGIFNTIRHPVVAVTNTVTLPYDLITDRNGRRTGLSDALHNHPLRVTTSLVIGTGTSFLAAGAVGGLHAATSTGVHSGYMYTTNPAIVAQPAFSLGYANTSASISLATNISDSARLGSEAEEKSDGIYLDENKKFKTQQEFNLNDAMIHTMEIQRLLIETAHEYNIDISKPVSEKIFLHAKNSGYGFFQKTKNTNSVQSIEKSDDYSVTHTCCL